MSAQGALCDGNASGPAISIGLIETLRWEPATGFARLERHLARLAGSAAALGLLHDAAAVRHALEAAVGGATPLRVRLELAPDGAPSVTTHPFAPLALGTVWTLAIAGTVRLDSADPLLRHKTTRRQAYEQARAEHSSASADEVILLNERGEVCEGTITSVFIDRGDGGPLLTPPLASGLLAGVLRQELLDEGRAVEAVLTPDDLASAAALHVGNSLRGLIRARLAEAPDTTNAPR